GGDLWVGTPNGLNLLHRRTADPSTALRSGRDDKMEGSAVPTDKQAVRVERFTSADGLPDDFIRSLYSDRDGSLWIGTRHGLAHLAAGKFTSYSAMDGVGSDFIGAIFRSNQGDPGRSNQGDPGRSNQGDLWVGTSGGLSRLDHGAFLNST